MHPAVAELLEYSGGVIGRRQHPELATRMDASVRRGELRAVLPGVYVPTELRCDWRTLASAVPLWDRGAVIVGEAAAALTFWPELSPAAIEIASRRSTASCPGYRFTRRDVPEAFVTRLATVRMSSPALTALDLAIHRGGDAIDRALRSRMTTVSDMYDALGTWHNRRGNRHRRQLLLDSRSNGWSAAERLAHRLFRSAGITQWVANVRFRVPGHTFYLDIEMTDCPLVVEIDGKVHLRDDMFESDRHRGNLLLLAGRQVLHFTWKMLTEQPNWVVDTTRRARELLLDSDSS